MLVASVLAAAPFMFSFPAHDDAPGTTVEVAAGAGASKSLVCCSESGASSPAAWSTDLKDGEGIIDENGQTLTIQIEWGAVKANDATVDKAGVPASNGVIHVIDMVLLPDDIPSASRRLDFADRPKVREEVPGFHQFFGRSSGVPARPAFSPLSICDRSSRPCVCKSRLRLWSACRWRGKRDGTLTAEHTGCGQRAQLRYGWAVVEAMGPDEPVRNLLLFVRERGWNAVLAAWGAASRSGKLTLATELAKTFSTDASHERALTDHDAT